MNVVVNVYSKSNKLPSYETAGAAGMDVRSIESVTLRPGEVYPVSTGLYVEIPQGYEIQVRPRSGLSLKTPLRVSNAPGTIDADYRGEIKVLMWNTGDQEVRILEGDRIAQLVLCEVPRIVWLQHSTLEALQPTERGEGGFGSTGSK